MTLGGASWRLPDNAGLELYSGFDSPKRARGHVLYFIMHWLHHPFSPLLRPSQLRL